MKFGKMLPLAVVALFTGATLNAAEKPVATGQNEQNTMVTTNQVVGATIRNSQNEDLTTVDDVVMNKEGVVQYLIASVGGYAGILQESIAIPIKSVECNVVQTDGEQQLKLTLPMTLEKLQESPKLELDEYTELTNRAWISQNNSHFSHDSAKDAPKAGSLWMFSNLNDQSVKCSQGKECGHVDDLVISTADHKAVFAILGNGGALSIGESYTAVPFKALSVKETEDGVQISVNQPSNEIEALPKVTSPDYAELNNEKVRNMINSSFK